MKPRGGVAIDSALISRLSALEEEPILVAVNVNGASRRKLAGEDRLGERVLHPLADSTLQRPCSVNRVKSGITKMIQRSRGEFESDLALFETLAKMLDLDLCNGVDLFAPQRMEHHDLVEAVDELGAKMAADDLHHR